MDNKKKQFVGPMLLMSGDEGEGGDDFNFGDPDDDIETGGKTGQHGE